MKVWNQWDGSGWREWEPPPVMEVFISGEHMNDDYIHFCMKHGNPVLKREAIEIDMARRMQNKIQEDWKELIRVGHMLRNIWRIEN